MRPGKLCERRPSGPRLTRWQISTPDRSPLQTGFATWWSRLTERRQWGPKKYCTHTKNKNIVQNFALLCMQSNWRHSLPALLTRSRMLPEWQWRSRWWVGQLGLRQVRLPSRPSWLLVRAVRARARTDDLQIFNIKVRINQTIYWIDFSFKSYGLVSWNMWPRISEHGSPMSLKHSIEVVTFYKWII